MFNLLHQRPSQTPPQLGFANKNFVHAKANISVASYTSEAKTSTPELITVAKYFVLRLKQLGVNDIWGLSGDYIGGLLDIAIENEIKVHTPATEQEGGYAANGYAMSTKKPGVIVTTYGVGTFNTVNAISTGWVGMTPMIVINGSPSKSQFQSNRHQGILYHHMMEHGRYAERDVFQPITAEALIITEPGIATAQIDNALLACITHKIPVYLEFEDSIYGALVPPPVGELQVLPAESIKGQVENAVDFVLRHFESPANPTPPYGPTINTTIDSVSEAMAFLQSVKVKKPLIWQGAEINRYNAEKEFQEFIEASGIPYVSSIDGKGAISEFNENFQGVYCGNFTSDKRVVDIVNNCDFFISLGVWYTDVSLGGTNLAGTTPAAGQGTLNNAPPKLYVDASRLSVQTTNREIANVVNIKSFLKELTRKFQEGKYKVDKWATTKYEEKIFPELLAPTQPLTYDVFFNWFKSHLITLDKADTLKRENVVCIADATLAIFPAMTIKVHQNCAFSEIVWGSIGWSSGSSVGIAVAQQKKRVFVFIGDGGFQNCSTGPSTAALDNLNPIYYVFQNNTYAIDQYLIDKTSIPHGEFKPYNLLPKWDYAKLADAFNCEGRNARTVDDVQKYTTEALASSKPFIIAVHIPITNVPDGLATE